METEGCFFGAVMSASKGVVTHHVYACMPVNTVFCIVSHFYMRGSGLLSKNAHTGIHAYVQTAMAQPS